MLGAPREDSRPRLKATYPYTRNGLIYEHHTAGQIVNDADDTAIALLRSLGCPRRYRGWALQRPIGAEPPATPVLPAGYELRSMTPGEERAVLDVIENAFGTGRAASTTGRRRASGRRASRPGARP